MRVCETLDVGAIVTGASWPGFDQAVAGLVARLVACGRLPPALEAQAVTVVCERERISSTAMVDIGVSIPHARLAGIDRIASALAVSSSAVFGATEWMPISIVALVLTPPDLTGEHLNFLSALAMLLHSPALRRTLQVAPTAQAVFDLIAAHER